MAIYLHEKYGDKLVKAFTRESFLSGKSNSGWSFTGVKTVKIPSVITQSLDDYDRTAAGNRYGTPAELQDTYQECEITQDKSFSIVIDKGNNSEQQMVKKAGEVMKQQIKEQVVPLIDKYALKRWARQAGKVKSLSAAPAADTILGMLVDIEAHFDDNLVPVGNRFVALPNPYVGLLRQSLTGCDGVTDKLLLKGIVGRFGTLNVLGVPSDWMPSDAYFLAWQQESVILCQKIRDNKLHMDPPGYSGSLLEGRYNYDAFVIGTLCSGCYLAVSSGYKTATPTATKGSTTTALANTTNGGTVSIRYTLDGTDPRFSPTAATYSGAFANPTANTVIKAVAFYEGTDHYYYDSDILIHTCV